MSPLLVWLARLYMHMYTYDHTLNIKHLLRLSLCCGGALTKERAQIVGCVPQVFKGLPVQAFSLIPVFPVLFIPNFILMLLDKVFQIILSPIYGAPLLPELDLAK